MFDTITVIIVISCIFGTAYIRARALISTYTDPIKNKDK